MLLWKWLFRQIAPDRGWAGYFHTFRSDLDLMSLLLVTQRRFELICKSDHKAPLHVWYVQRITVAEFLCHTLAVQETFPVFHVKMEVHITSQDRWLIKIRLNLRYLYMWKQLLKLLESCWNFKARISKGFFCLSDVKILLWNLKIDSVCLPTQKQN